MHSVSYLYMSGVARSYMLHDQVVIMQVSDAGPVEAVISRGLHGHL